MPKNTQLTDLAVNVQANALAALVDGGFVDVMTGKQPDAGDIDITDQVLLVTMGFGKPAFRGAMGGVLSSNGITAGVAISDGDPTWFRAYGPDRRTPVFDGSAGVSDSNMILPAKTVIRGITVSCSGITHSVVKSMAGI
jgi:hypothetical protein